VENTFIELPVVLILSLVANLVLYFSLVRSNWKASRLRFQVEQLNHEKRELHHALLASQTSLIASTASEEGEWEH
jgi:sensor domain CHASE-containing protein